MSRTERHKVHSSWRTRHRYAPATQCWNWDGMERCAVYRPFFVLLVPPLLVWWIPHQHAEWPIRGPHCMQMQKGRLVINPVRYDYGHEKTFSQSQEARFLAENAPKCIWCPGCARTAGGAYSAPTYSPSRIERAGDPRRNILGTGGREAGEGKENKRKGGEWRGRTEGRKWGGVPYRHFCFPTSSPASATKVERHYAYM